MAQGTRPPLFLYQTEARRAEKNFFETPLPLSEGLGPPLLPHRMLKSQTLPKGPIHAPVVQKLDISIHRINHCPVNSAIQHLNNWGQYYTNPKDHAEVGDDLPEAILVK